MKWANTTVTLYIPYAHEGDTKYSRLVIDNCKFNPTNAVVLGNVQVQGANMGKLLIFEEDLDMDNYVKPIDFTGLDNTFTIKNESIVVIGALENDIVSVKDLKGYEHYTIKSVLHQNYSFVLPFQFICEVA